MKTIGYMAMSVNGMIATGTEETPWSDTIWRVYVDTVAEFGNIVVGRRTYEFMRDGGDFDSFKTQPETVVITAGEHGVLSAHSRKKSPAEALKHLEDKGFERVLVGGGAQTITSFLREGRLDELWLDVEPVLIGGGINLLSEELQIRLSFTDTISLGGGVIRLRYAVAGEQS